ncbi:MAG: MFS transporter [Eubacteriaceae bacterium]|nr:MFS transporter [Eubacteriaceae bacterium]
MMKKPLSPAIKRLYGIADLGFGMMSQIESTYFALFLTDYAQFPLALSGLILSLTSTFDAIFAALPGVVIEKANMKWGRYRSWMLIGPPIVALTYPFQYVKLGNSTVAASVIIFAFVFSHLVWNTHWMCNLSMITVLANNPDERMLLSSHRTAYSSVARIVFGYVGPPVLVLSSKLIGNDMYGFPALAFIMSCFMVASYLVVFSITKGYDTDTVQITAKAKENTSFGDMVKVIGTNPPLFIHMIVDLFRSMGANFVSTLATYYFRYSIGNMGWLGTYLIINGIACFFGAMTVPYVTKLIKDTKIRYVAYCGAIIATLLVTKLNGLNATGFIVCMAIYNFFYQALQASNPLMYASATIYGEWKTGKSMPALINGCSTVILKIGITMRGAAVAFGLGMYNFVANQTPTPQLQHGILTLLTIVPSVMTAMSALVCLVFYKLDDERVNELQAEIDARKPLQRNSL